MITREKLETAAARRCLCVHGPGPEVFEIRTPGGAAIGRISTDGHYSLFPGVCGCFRGELCRVSDEAKRDGINGIK